MPRCCRHGQTVGRQVQTNTLADVLLYMYKSVQMQLQCLFLYYLAAQVIRVYRLYCTRGECLFVILDGSYNSTEYTLLQGHTELYHVAPTYLVSLRRVPWVVLTSYVYSLPGMYVCMYGHIYSKSKDQPRKVANPARGQLNRENKYYVCMYVWSHI